MLDIIVFQIVFFISCFRHQDLLPATVRYCHDCVMKTDCVTTGGDSPTEDVLYLLLALLQHKVPTEGDSQTPAGYPLDFTPVINRYAALYSPQMSDFVAAYYIWCFSWM